jgi:hypothetical protein
VKELAMFDRNLESTPPEVNSTAVAEVQNSLPTAKGFPERRVQVESSPVKGAGDWDAVLRRYQEKVPAEKKLSYRLLHRDDDDPRRLEVKEAKRRMFFAMLKASYQDRADTGFWAILVLLLSAFVLMPFVGILKGYLFASYVTLSWIVLHNMRRNEGRQQRVSRR